MDDSLDKFSRLKTFVIRSYSAFLRQRIEIHIELKRASWEVQKQVLMSCNLNSAMFILTRSWLCSDSWQTLEDSFSEGRKLYRFRNHVLVGKLLTRSIRFTRLRTSPTSTVHQIFVTDLDDFFTIYKAKLPLFCNVRGDLWWNFTKCCQSLTDYP